MKKSTMLINIIAILMSIVISFLQIDPHTKYMLIFLTIIIQTYIQDPPEKKEQKYYDLFYLEIGVIFIIELLDIIMISNLYNVIDKIVLVSINLIDFSLLCVISTYFSYKVFSIKRQRIKKKRR